MLQYLLICVAKLTSKEVKIKNEDEDEFSKFEHEIIIHYNYHSMIWVITKAKKQHHQYVSKFRKKIEKTFFCLKTYLQVWVCDVDHFVVALSTQHEYSNSMNPIVLLLCLLNMNIQTQIMNPVLSSCFRCTW